jgi:uncharacterized protein
MDKIISIKEAYEELEAIYQQVPSFTCKSQCTDCCGPIFYTELEASRFAKSYVIPTSTKCPFSKVGGCSIYENRPIICRLFGATENRELTCSFGCGPTFRLDNEYAKSLITQVCQLSIKAGFGAYMFETHKGFLGLIQHRAAKIIMKDYRFR